MLTYCRLCSEIPHHPPIKDSSFLSVLLFSLFSRSRPAPPAPHLHPVELWACPKWMPPACRTSISSLLFPDSIAPGQPHTQADVWWWPLHWLLWYNDDEYTHDSGDDKLCCLSPGRRWVWCHVTTSAATALAPSQALKVQRRSVTTWTRTAVSTSPCWKEMDRRDLTMTGVAIRGFVGEIRPLPTVRGQAWPGGMDGAGMALGLCL